MPYYFITGFWYQRQLVCSLHNNSKFGNLFLFLIVIPSKMLEKVRVGWAGYYLLWVTSLFDLWITGLAGVY